MPEFNAIHGRDGLTLLVGDRGRIQRWNDEGFFSPMISPTQRDLCSVFVRSADAAYAVGRGGTFLRFDGYAWTAIDSHTSADLQAVHAPGKGEVWVGGDRVLLRFRQGTPVLSRTFSRFVVCAIEPAGTGGRELWFLGNDRALLRWDGQDLHDIPIFDSPAAASSFRYLIQSALWQTTPPMEEGRFWALVQELGWGRETTHYPSVRDALCRKLPILEVMAMCQRFEDLRRRLHHRIEEWREKTSQVLMISDDGLLDLTSHLVGLGQKEYEVAHNDPASLLPRAKRGDFTESFAYVFQVEDSPYPTDDFVRALLSQAPPRRYVEGGTYQGDEFLLHPELGPGVVTEAEELRPGFARVVFADGERLLPVKVQRR